jgi:membrane-associated phospholipid phosphatase
MTAPKDHNRESTVGMVRTARILSNIISPPVIFAGLGLALSWRELPFWSGLLWAAIYGFWVSLVPILFVVYRLRSGHISDLHMNTTRERRLPYLVSVAGALVACGFVLAFGGPELLLCLSVFSMIELAILALINDFWKISIHATSIAGATVVVALVFGPEFGLLLVPVVALVSWLRLYLRRHTATQVLAGLLLGTLAPLVLTLFGCFEQV